MNNILKQIYTNVEATNKSVVSTNATLQKLLKLEQAEFKRDEKAKKDKDKIRRREKQAASRKSGDKNSILGKLSDKEKKKEKKSIMDILLGALGGIGKSIMGGLSSLGGLVSTALVSALGGLGIGSMLAAGAPILVGALGALVLAAVLNRDKVRKALDNSPVRNADTFVDQAVTRATGRTYSDDRRKNREALQTASQDLLSEQSRRNTGGQPQMTDEELSALYDTVEKLEEIDEKMIARDKMTSELSHIADNLEKYNKNPDDIPWWFHWGDPEGWAKRMESQGREIEDQLKDNHKGLKNLGVDVKPLVLPTEGIIKRQIGGLIPTLLEPGEKVFMPGQWNDSIAALNDAIPRFQTGGIIETSHPNTGSGWGIDGLNDSKGRPAVFSKEAAEAWMKMMQESDGKVKGADITSSQRSREYNAGLSGAASNSGHLYGEAVDVNSGSPTWTWMRNHGHKHGWQFNDYAGQDGWHFDYVGPGAGRRPIPEGLDGAQEKGKGNGFSADGLLKSLGPVGGILAGMGEGISELMGSMDLGSMFGIGMKGAGGASQGIMGMFSGMFGGSSPGNGGSGDYSHVQASGDYSRDALVKALDSHGITDKKERAMFLAQMHLESDGFNAREEYSGGHDYYGGGKKYKGRGYIQLTHDYNYKKYGDIIGVDLLNNPDLAADPTNAAKIALAYWDSRVSKEAARGGDVSTVTRNIQGGQRHLAERTDLYNHYLQKGYQTGGIVGGVGNMGMSRPLDLERLFEATVAHNDALVTYANADPIIVFDDPEPVSMTDNAQPNQDPPTLPNGPSSTQAAEYFYNLNSTSNF